MTDAAPDNSPTNEVRQNLRMLAISHYILGAITAATFPVWAYMAWLGKPLLYPPPEALQRFDPALESSLELGAFLLMFGVLMAALSLMHGGVMAYLGRCLARRKRWWLVVIVSFFNLTYVPLGTVVSLLTLVVLMRPVARRLFRSPHGKA